MVIYYYYDMVMHGLPAETKRWREERFSTIFHDRLVMAGSFPQDPKQDLPPPDRQKKDLAGSFPPKLSAALALAVMM